MKYLFFFLCLVCTPFVFAQYTDTKIITVNEGLISNNIQSSYTDSQNNLWLGSRAGLFVKSGSTFEKVPQATKYKFNNISDIVADRQNGKWVAGLGQGVLFFNQKGSKLINDKTGLINNKVRTLLYHNDKVYVGTLNGVSIISTKDFSVINPKFHQNPNYFLSFTSFFVIKNKVYATTLNDGIFEVNSEKLLKVSNLKKVFSSFVYKDQLFVGTQNNLYEINTTSFEINQTFNINNVNKFLVIANDLYFISAGVFENSGGFFQLKNNKVINKTQALKIPFSDLKTISYDSKNQLLYLGSNYNGLIQVNLNAPVFHQDKVGAVHTLCVQNGKQFVFHDKGFSIFNNQTKEKEITLNTFKDFQLKNPSKHKEHAVIKNHFYPLDYETPANKIIFYSSQIHKNSLWVSSNIGMFELDFKGNILSYHPVHVFYFTFFKNDLVMAVPYAGVRVFKNIHAMDYSYTHDWENPNVPSEIVSIAQTNNAVYFASALSGLYEYKDGKYRSFLQDKSFTEAKIKRICTTKNNELVVVTDYNDVYILDVSKTKSKIIKHISYEKIKGSSTNFVHELKGVLYISTNEGINVFKNNKHYFIDKAQGYTDYNSVMAASFNNNLHIATNKGVFELSTDYFFKTQTTNDTAKINAVFVNNKLLKDSLVENKLTLAHNENNLQVVFSVPNAKYPDKLKFKYRLKKSEEWQELTKGNQINLNYLNNDTYNIQLQITNEDTANTTNQTLLCVTIKTPFYATLPFIISCLFLVLILSFMAYKLRVNFLRQQQQRELALTSLKNQQDKKQLVFEKQLADVKLQALKSQMNSHFLFNVLSSIQYFIICKDVDNALYYLERFSTLIRTTLTYSDKKSITLYEEINYLKQYIEIENLRAEHKITFTEQLSEDIDATKIEIVPLLLQPFVENAIVHAFPPSVIKPEIVLKIEKVANTIKIIIADNGIGYQQKTTSAHQSKGISIVQKRLNLTQKNLQNPIEITSSNKGTQVVIYF